MRDDFAIFILSHARPELVSVTIDSLAKAQYNGRWYIVLDSEDETAPEYVARWGAERILTFDKDEVAKTFDLADNGGSRGVIIYARNVVDELAAALGLRYYQQLDDDYNHFAHRFNKDGRLGYVPTLRYDAVIETFIDFLDVSGALTVAFAQGGDLLSGIWGYYRSRPVLRKAMNTFIARVGRPIRFVGRINEDVNTYVWRGGQGELFFTITDFAISQAATQEQTGGMSAAYVGGTYRKSFYTVMFAPSCVKVSTTGQTTHRIHHRIAWNNAVPKIISGRWHKE